MDRTEQIIQKVKLMDEEILELKQQILKLEKEIKTLKRLNNLI